MSKKTYNSGEPSLGLELEEETATEQKDPVTVLGLTFANDDERREYFRAELRRKLPELRNIEGFPIGEDDDIIALSDPPYYTACPNPWLNDFIAEWEAEKKDLEAKGLRKTDFEVTEPYSADVSEGKNNPIYNAHSYHTKVPHPAIMRYILHYTQPGDIIFDGFCGTGMTGVAANMCEDVAQVNSLSMNNVKVGARHSICSDISPIASLIAANYNLSFYPSVFEREVNNILDKVEKEFGWMYETFISSQKFTINNVVWSDVFLCPNCGEEICLWDYFVNPLKEEVLDSTKCRKCGVTISKKNLIKKFHTVYDKVLEDSISIIETRPCQIYCSGNKTKEADQLDTDKLQQIEDSLDFSYHTERLPEGDESRRNDKVGISYTHQFYTSRNYICLSKIYELVKNNPILLAWFTSSLFSTSKMNKFRFSGTGTTSGTFYISSLNREFNVLNTLRRKISSFSQCYYNGRNNSLVNLISATNLNISNNKIDYIFVDPPFGANIMYSELNSLWESWLHIRTDNTKEAIVNKTQNKTLFDYQTLMNASFKEFYRVLKPGKWLTMEFSNTSASVWNSIQNALQGVGFIIANVAALDKKQGSFKAVTTTTAVKQDLIISCFKPSEKLLEHFENMRQSDDNQNIFVSTQSFIEELLTRLPVIIVNEKKTTAVVERSPKILYDRLIAFFVQNGRQIPMDASEFQRFLRDTFVERDGMFFTAEQAIKYDDLRRQNPEMVSLALFVGSEADGVQWLKRELADKPQTYQDLQPKWMQDLVAPKKGDAIPELMQILEENFLKNEDSQWYIPDAENEADLEKVRTRRLLREFKTYVEAAEKPKGRIKEARLEALRTGFKNCYQEKDFATIVRVGDRIPQSLLTEDDVLLQYYDIATNRI